MQELTSLLDGLAHLALLPPDISLKTNQGEDETGETIEAIAAGKATAWSQRIDEILGVGSLVVSSDGGLLMPALGSGWDPTKTRRFAGSNVNARARADALIRLTSHLDGDQRQIGWREAVAFARRGEVVGVFVAESAPGYLAGDYDPALLDADGFWMPALWICPEFGGRRLAELTPEERAHRDDHWSLLRRQVQRACMDDSDDQ